MRTVFADPKTDVVFKRIFGSEEHKDLLIALLDALLELDDAHRIEHVDLLPPEQRPYVDGLKYSIVDVKCRDARGQTYVVEMQILNVEAFEKRVVYNVTKAYVNQLAAGEGYPALNDVIGVTLCDFELWPRGEGTTVPMLSRWRMQEQHGGARGLSQIQFVFLELPKLDRTREPVTMLEKWAYFFREAVRLTTIPTVLAEPPIARALDVARAARFTEDEWDAYIRAGMAIQDERGAHSLALKQGEALGLRKGEALGLRKGKELGIREGKELGIREGKELGIREGEALGLRRSLRRVFARRGLETTAEQDARIDGCGDGETLERWLEAAIVEASAADVLR